MKAMLPIATLILVASSGATAVSQAKKPATKPALSRTAPAKAQPVPQPQKVPSVYYDFKGAKLGMTLEEWKAVEAPISTSSSSFGGRDDGPERIWCSNDKMPDGKPITGTFYLSDAESALGVIACKYGRLGGTSTYRYIKASYVKIGEYISDDVDYKFLDNRLYEVNITGSKNLLADIMDGLTAKFGEPTGKVDDTTQNKAGSTFPHMERLWINPVASIHLETPYTKIDNLNVTYMAVESISRIAAKKRELHPAADKM